MAGRRNGNMRRKLTYKPNRYDPANPDWSKVHGSQNRPTPIHLGAVTSVTPIEGEPCQREAKHSVGT